MEYYLYRLNKTRDYYNKKLTIKDSLKVEVIKPSTKFLITKKISLIDYAWSVITMNKYHICRVKSADDEVVHKSCVVGKSLKFPFLNKTDYEIGPCFTVPAYRGQGIYPYVIRYIVDRFDGVSFYMIVHKSNSKSIRGIEKAGFEKIGYVSKSKLGQWRYWNGLDIQE